MHSLVSHSGQLAHWPAGQLMRFFAFIGSPFFSLDPPPSLPLMHLLAGQQGEVAEWSIAQHWKCCVPQGTEGSNPSLSAS